MVATKSEIPALARRALVVDDSQIARYILSGLLSRHGFEVEVADSAEEALHKLAGALPDVVFLDHLLPGIDGLETVGRLRAQPRTSQLPVVMYTSQDSQEFVARAINAGADDVYMKTSDESRLAEILQKLELLPDRSPQPNDSANVTPISTRARVGESKADNRSKLTLASLAKLLEPSLEAHHARLHQELLAEFAILERYEERMRRDLFARTDALTRNTTGRIDQAFDEYRSENRRRQRRGIIGVWATAATVLLGIALTLGSVVQLDQRAERLESDSARTFAALDSQTRAVDMLSLSLLDARQAVPAFDSDPRSARAPATKYDNEHNVADALIAELQSMGILGPVRIETAAGSFCVTSTLGGFGIEASNLSLRQCEPLPLQLGANRP